MQDEAIEVESNLMEVDKLRSKVDRDRRKVRSKTLTSGSSTSHPHIDDLTKLVKSLSAEMEKVKLEERQAYINTQNVDNRGNFRIPNNAPQIIPREQRNIKRNDQNI